MNKSKNQKRDSYKPKVAEEVSRIKVPAENIYFPKFMKKFKDWAPEREGIFEHQFECINCNLHWKLYSWVEFKHNSTNVTCPECGIKGRQKHGVKALSKTTKFNAENKIEIFKLFDSITDMRQLTEDDMSE